MSSLGNPLKRWIKEQGITREKFAEQVGWSVPFAIDFVNEKHPKIDLFAFDRLLEVTKIPYDDLMGWLKRVQRRKLADSD